MGNKYYTGALINLEDVDLDDLVEFIQDKCRPDEVFGQIELEEWAENNGYVKES